MMRPAVVLVVIALVVGACTTGDGAEPVDTTVAPTTSTTEVTTTTEATTTTSSSTTTSTTTMTTMATTTTAPPQLAELTIDVAGIPRQYTLFAPGAATGLPLVIDLHGFTSSSAEQERLTSMQELAAAEGFVVAQPQGRGGILAFWDVSPFSEDLPFIRALIDDAAERVGIDRDRVYAVGMSNGGGLANRLACSASDVITAIGPVAGAYSFANECEPERPVPVIAFHGTDDRVVPYGGGLLTPPVGEWIQGWADRNGCSGSTVEQFTDDVVQERWEGCDADVVLYTVQGGAHGWPGTGDPERADSTTATVSASEILWETLSAYRR